jgi:hypothetical protein
LVPFADERFADAGPVCFDTRSPVADADYPVVLWDHEFVGTAEEIRPLFSSTTAMFRCLVFLVEHELGNQLFWRDDTDSQELVAAKEVALKQFLDLDPQGAGGPGRSWFTCWGITP